MTRPVIDAHLHFWDPQRLSYPWLEADGLDEIPRSYLPADFRGDVGDIEVRATVHVQAEVDHALDPALETAWLSELAEHDGLPTVAVGYADLRSPDLADTLDRHERFALFRGVRQEAWFDPASTRADIPRQNLLDDPAWVSGLAELDRRDLVFELLVWRTQLRQAAEIFADLPGLSVVLEHTALPVDPDDHAAWRTDLGLFLAEVPQAMLKISALGFADPLWRPDVVDPLIRDAVAIAGPARCIFASNFPVERPGIGYAEVWQTFERCTADLDETERDAMFRGNAATVYGIPGN